MHVGVQFSRGCPFDCEFCSVIELNGRRPRTKTLPQVRAELDALRALGHRGHVDFVDDNLIGNKKAVKPLLRSLAAWNAERGHPFEFTTEASLNLADDGELLSLMRAANFIGRIAVRPGWRERGARRWFWAALLDCLLHNPRALRISVSFAALYLHFGPFSRWLIARLEGQIAESAKPWAATYAPCTATGQPVAGSRRPAEAGGSKLGAPP